MKPQEKAEAFVKELRTVVEKHYGQLPKDETEPFGMKLRQLLPTVSADTGSISTTVTLTIPLDQDAPDSDD